MGLFEAVCSKSGTRGGDRGGDRGFMAGGGDAGAHVGGSIQKAAFLECRPILRIRIPGLDDSKKPYRWNEIFTPII